MDNITPAYNPRRYDWNAIVAAVKGELYVSPVATISVSSASRRAAILWADEQLRSLQTIHTPADEGKVMEDMFAIADRLLTRIQTDKPQREAVVRVLAVELFSVLRVGYNMGRHEEQMLHGGQEKP